MKWYRIIYSLFTLIAVQLFPAYSSMAQTSNFSIRDGNMVLTIPKDWTQASCDSTMNYLDLAKINVDSLIKKNMLGELGKEGWKIRKHPKIKGTIELYKPVSDLHGKFIKSLDTDLMRKVQASAPAKVDFGRNKISFTHIREDKNGITTIELKGHIEAKKVMISGNFNQWSVMLNPMQKTTNGWQVKLPLAHGKTLYKFIIDGKWIHDEMNPQIEPNGTNGLNSVYFRTNYTFVLEGFESAKTINLAGNFNDWNQTEINMLRKEDGWYLPVFLNEGTHYYKFIVDGKWILDPKNENSRQDGFGNTNSFITLGIKTKFSLQGYPDASKITVCGSFNNWNPDEISLRKINGIWSASHPLPRGNHEYKFVVDGKWIPDPHNSIYHVTAGEKNSVISVEPNHCFILSGFPKASRVILAGTFNDWNPDGYTMQRNGDKWELSLYLPPGKHLYKFIVDGQWMIDPGNPYWEQNEHNTGNSILWMDSEITMNK